MDSLARILFVLANQYVVAQLVGTVHFLMMTRHFVSAQTKLQIQAIATLAFRIMAELVALFR